MMFKKKKSKGLSRKAPYLFQTATNTLHWSWCIKNNIGICIVPNWDVADVWMVEITINGNINLDPVDYKGSDALAKMYEYCKYYYEKHNKNENKV
tara:strand:- start:360 stop:644 length:285 start_codon:yes stop_codon:yes gene_type:complete